MSDIFAIAPHPRLPVVGQDKFFPVRRVWCVGQNYADHAREMGSDPTRQPPFFFAKSPDMVVVEGGSIAYPSLTNNFHFEGELVIALGASSEGKAVSVEEADSLIFGYGCGLDFTRRDLQAEFKAKGRPWELAKAFDCSAPVGAITVKDQAREILGADLELRVNGVTKQKGRIADMIWQIPEIVAELSKAVSLAAGDLIFTGTPSGVGPLVVGDHVQLEITGLSPLTAKIVEKGNGL